MLSCGQLSTFAAATLLPAGSSIHGVVAGDVSSDGHVDVAILGRDNTFVYVLGDADDGSFRAAHRYSLAGGLSAAVLAAAGRML